MRDYVKEMMELWTSEGEQAAYGIGAKLLEDISEQREYLDRQESAIHALGLVLQGSDNVDTSLQPVEIAPELDEIEPSERSRLIVKAATEVWKDQQTGWPGADSDLVKAQRVLDQLRADGLDLGVQQPLAVIGTVLASASGFKKVARNTFERIEPAQVDDDDDLPW